MDARVIALGNLGAQDDGAAILAAERLKDKLEVVIAGRPGTGLLDLLEGDQAVVLVDVTQSGQPPGHIMCVPLAQLTQALDPSAQVSCHGFGPTETLRLGRALGRSLPPGFFVGVEGQHYTVGQSLSPAVVAVMDQFVATIHQVATTGSSSDA